MLLKTQPQLQLSRPAGVAELPGNWQELVDRNLAGQRPGPLPALRGTPHEAFCSRRPCDFLHKVRARVHAAAVRWEGAALPAGREMPAPGTALLAGRQKLSAGLLGPSLCLTLSVAMQCMMLLGLRFWPRWAVVPMDLPATCSTVSSMFVLSPAPVLAPGHTGMINRLPAGPGLQPEPAVLPPSSVCTSAARLPARLPPASPSCAPEPAAVALQGASHLGQGVSWVLRASFSLSSSVVPSCRSCRPACMCQTTAVGSSTGTTGCAHQGPQGSWSCWHQGQGQHVPLLVPRLQAAPLRHLAYRLCSSRWQGCRLRLSDTLPIGCAASGGKAAGCASQTPCL